MKAIIYARTSGDDLNKTGGQNIQSQLDMCQEYAQGQGWQIVAELAENERGASGADMNLPELNRALEMARDGRFDVLVVREIDRFARSLAKQLIIETEFIRAGVRIEYVLGEYPDTPEGQLNKNIKAVIAEYERLKIYERMTRGRRRELKRGVVLSAGRSPYGYDLVRDGDKLTLALNEDEARVVQFIFSLYVDDGLSIKATAEKLTSLGIPTRGDTSSRQRKKRGRGEWLPSTVGQILKNETYVGVWHYGKTKLITLPDGKRKQVRTSREEWTAVPVPAILDTAVWEAAQAKKRENFNYARRNRKYDYLLSGRLTCGECGTKMHGFPVNNGRKIYLYYRCMAGTGLLANKQCDMPYQRVGQIDRTVWAWVRDFIADPGRLQEYQANMEDDTEPLRLRLQVVNDLVAEYQQQLNRLIDLYLSGDIEKSLLLDKKERLEKTVADLENERRQLEKQLQAARISESEMEKLQEVAAGIRAGLAAADTDLNLQREIIRLLGVRGVLARGGEGEGTAVHVICDFGQELYEVETALMS